MMQNLVKWGRGKIEDYAQEYTESSMTPGVCCKASQLYPTQNCNSDGTLNYEWVIYYTVTTIEEKKEEKPKVQVPELKF
jgi:hypothetical protein